MTDRRKPEDRTCGLDFAVINGSRENNAERQGADMRRILAVLWSEDDPEPVAGAAFAVAHRFGAEVVGLAVRPPPGEFIPSGDFGIALSQDYLDRLHRDAGARAGRLRDRFHAMVAAEGLPEAANTPAGSVCAQWLDAEGSAATFVGSYGRAFDLIVVRKPDMKVSAETEILFEAALFEAGRPVLVVPTAPATIGDVVTIAWNGSSETARTISLGLPLLKLAKRVEVVSVENFGVPGPTAGDISQYLSRHGIDAAARHLPGSDSTAGEVFLQEAKVFGSDLIFKGAYTQSRLRQLIFGGATRHMLQHTTLPMLMAH
jgi:nucleotide-binding universal stress UspA family protein